MIDWPLALAERFHSFITDSAVSDPLLLLNQLKVKSSLLSWDFLDIYFPMQPTLMNVLILSVCALIVLFLTISGASFYIYSTRTKDQLYDVTKKYKNDPSFNWSFAAMIITWLTLLLGTVYLIVYNIFLTNNYMNAGELATFKDSNVSSDKFLEISINNAIVVVNRKPKQTSKFGETDILNKYNNLREMGYEYKLLEPALGFFMQTIVLVAISLVYVIFLAFILIMICAKIKDVYRDSGERSSSLLWFSRMAKVMSFVMLVCSVLVLCFSIVFLLYSQVHRVICPYVQVYLQNLNLEEYVNSNFAYFDPNNLVDFLSDLSAERVEINEANCNGFVRPIEGIWFCLWLIGVASFAMGVCLWFISNQMAQFRPKMYITQKETFGTLTKKPLTSVFSPMSTFR
ncbi:unnamed protein product [Bursaphelenchus xylophilus]|uniref:(pine wood nematode) hypothetical protein n=1 Tax=Bursaphelenchus xylophilus TaxID=6326 RepID=A0A1I7SSC5_BURXY|nr:unnamed protein product [Bursaphelenchus xylophilus]CAG9097733.1 unnamed protein product [Bursaphelenchus xylophilus]